MKLNAIADLQKRVVELEKENRTLTEKKHIVPAPVVNNNINITNNITNNVNLLCFGEDQRDRMAEIIQANIGILNRPPDEGVPHHEQLRDRVGDLITAIYRNPAHADMQGIYTVDNFDQLDKDNVYTFAEKAWQVGDWNRVSRDVMSDLHMCLERINKKDDVLKVVRAAFIAAGKGMIHDYKMSDPDMAQLYHHVGKRLVLDGEVVPESADR